MKEQNCIAVEHISNPDYALTNIYPNHNQILIGQHLTIQNANERFMKPNERKQRVTRQQSK